MKNLPVFSTEFGVAGLILDQIPYREEAYIHIHDSRDMEKLLAECAKFCRACGAEKIYAAGDAIPPKYEIYTRILTMRRDRRGIQDTDAALWPVQEETAEYWRKVYNERMAPVPAAKWMTLGDTAEMLRKGDGYFIHRGDMLLGIGRASAEMIDSVIAVCPGAGAEVVAALSHALTGGSVSVETASENKRAVRLYERLGFLTVAEKRVWYQIL